MTVQKGIVRIDGKEQPAAQKRANLDALVKTERAPGLTQEGRRELGKIARSIAYHDSTNPMIGSLYSHQVDEMKERFIELANFLKDLFSFKEVPEGKKFVAEMTPFENKGKLPTLLLTAKIENDNHGSLKEKGEVTFLAMKWNPNEEPYQINVKSDLVDVVYIGYVKEINGISTSPLDGLNYLKLPARGGRFESELIKYVEKMMDWTAQG